MDIGRKVKASQRQMMKEGKFIGARPPYGYLKAENDCHQLIIDPVAAPVVRQIFEWANEGAGLNTIAVRLNEAGVTAPSHYKRNLGVITHILPPIMQSPINCGAIAMMAGLVIVPVVSLFTPKPDKQVVEGCFACYTKKIEVEQRTALPDE